MRQMALMTGPRILIFTNAKPPTKTSPSIGTKIWANRIIPKPNSFNINININTQINNKNTEAAATSIMGSKTITTTMSWL